MRIYEGGPRQDWEEVLRSIGADIDARGIRGLVVLESETGLIVQGTSVSTGDSSSRGELMGVAERQTLVLDDEQIGTFMEGAVARRGRAPESTPRHYEDQLRVIGRFLDEKKPRDVLLFEVEGAYIARVTIHGQTGSKSELIEFTPDDITDLVAKAPDLRRPPTPGKPG